VVNLILERGEIFGDSVLLRQSRRPLRIVEVDVDLEPIAKERTAPVTMRFTPGHGRFFPANPARRLVRQRCPRRA
jgi:hypothetical protein